jgi:hypothetical protein
MESEITTAETGLDLPLAEPHFDDEATVLSARPVVPLDEVPDYNSQTPSRLPRGWMFVATIVGAMLLGVVAGGAYYSYANRESAQHYVEVDKIAAGAEGMSTETPISSASAIGAAEANHTAPADSPRESPAYAPRPEVSSRETRKPVARRVDVLTFPSTREERKAERRQAKAQKKELERASRDRDVMRIREIFEGTQRP